ncbi:MarR family winged helix-turn-helix transcriptional regulator [Actinoplanes sp. DH11]|uniref:MarR family winged helix-turn-helix transcriptional regulator n=1 Tax=Actinoplanes sp. DH11 TaxID=2857011 RepID=UPI001E60CC3E|nr:MarR family winged helix-turn-helix transcriptional regulator [Actinoplanes sp. DH11]
MGEVSEPRWLDDDQQQTWLAVAALMTRLPAALDAQLQRDSQLSHFEYQVLAGLSMAPERTLRMSALAAFAEGSLPRLSQVVAKMEKRGWVRRTPDPADGRFTLAILTDAGWDKLVPAAPGHVAEARRLVFDPLTKAQQRQLRDIARRIMRVIDPADPCLSSGPPGEEPRPRP